MFLTALILAVVSSRRTIVHPLVSLCYSYIKCKNKLKYRTDTDTAFPYYDRQSGRVVSHKLNQLILLYYNWPDQVIWKAFKNFRGQYYSYIAPPCLSSYMIVTYVFHSEREVKSTSYRVVDVCSSYSSTKPFKCSPWPLGLQTTASSEQIWAWSLGLPKSNTEACTIA